MVLENARRSLEEEHGCRQFDVCTEPQRPGIYFLYELYDDRAAFDVHLASEHFRVFDAATKDMLAGKTVNTWRRIAP
jgi:quinol monooxygenase YgiN